jgi:segregation and condensation protein B
MSSDTPCPDAAGTGSGEDAAAACPHPDPAPPAPAPALAAPLASPPEPPLESPLEPPLAAPLAEQDEDSLRLAEALVFASASPVSARSLGQLLPDTADADAVIAALRARYAGRGVELVETAGGVQFRTAPELSPRLRKVIEVPRRLPRVAMETLAIIAYHQPCTRAEIEEIRGTSLSQQTLDALLEANLVAPKGRREVPGRPTLWGTTPQFLTQFGLRDIRDLPQRTDLLLEPPAPSGVSDAPPITPELPAADPRPGAEAGAQAGESAEPAAAQNPAPSDDAPPSEGPSPAQQGEGAY